MSIIRVSSSSPGFGTEDTFNFLTFGGNYYLMPESHGAKITADIIWGFDDMSTGGSPASLGFGDTGLLGGSDGEFAFRGQLQLMF